MIEPEFAREILEAVCECLEGEGTGRAGKAPDTKKVKSARKKKRR